MKRILAFAIAVAFVYAAARGVSHSRAPRDVSPPSAAPAPSSSPAAPTSAPPSASDNSVIAQAYVAHESDVPVRGNGTVTRLLPDDTQGDHHQRFLVRLPSGQSVLIVHNIDIAPRVQGLRVGEPIEFEGEFVWNDKGGLIHWTHHDPSGRHRAGGIQYGGRTYR